MYLVINFALFQILYVIPDVSQVVQVVQSERSIALREELGLACLNYDHVENVPPVGAQQEIHSLISDREKMFNYSITNLEYQVLHLPCKYFNWKKFRWENSHE